MTLSRLIFGSPEGVEFSARNQLSSRRLEPVVQLYGAGW